MKNKHELNFTEQVTLNDTNPEDHSMIVNISTDGAFGISVNFNTVHIPLLDVRHLEIMVQALEDAFYRLRPDLRRQ